MIAGDAWWIRVGETPEAYAAFLAYRDQAAPRSLYRVHVAGKVIRPADATSWARQWDWPARAQAFDDSLRELRDAEAREVARMSARDRAMQRERLLNTAAGVANRELAKLLAACEASEMPGLVKAEVLLARIPDIVKALRLEHGETTDNVGGMMGHTACVDVSLCDVDELLAIQEILDRASAREAAK